MISYPVPFTLLCHNLLEQNTAGSIRTIRPFSKWKHNSCSENKFILQKSVNIHLNYNDHILLKFADSPDTLNVLLHRIIRVEFGKGNNEPYKVMLQIATCPGFPKQLLQISMGEVIAVWAKQYIIWSSCNIMNLGRNPSFTVVLFVWSPQLVPERLSQVVRL